MSKPSFEAEHRQSNADPEGGVRTALTKVLVAWECELSSPKAIMERADSIADELTTALTKPDQHPH